MKSSIRAKSKPVVSCAGFIGCVVMFAAMGCSEDLPVQEPVPDGTKMSGQSMAGTAETGGTSSEMTASGSAGQSTGAGMGAAAGGSGGGMSMGSGTAPGSMSAGGAAGGVAGAAGARPAGAAGTGSAMPVRVVAACMGRGGETVCDNVTLIKCGQAGDAEMMMPCKTAAQCRAGIASGMCGSCDPGTIECMGTELRECGMDGQFAVLDTCATEALCNKAGKMCDQPACEVDQHSCESGYLMKCAEDRTELEMLEPCEMELCDAEGKKCNVCVPSSKVCTNSSTLTTCTTDGSDSMDMDCGEGMKCETDRCVQCTSDSECMAPNDCQTATCNMESGMCNAPTSKTVGTACNDDGGKVCDLIGNCVACVTDLDCGVTGDERCSPLFGCVPRAPITASAISLLGSYTVTVAPGYVVNIDGEASCGSLLGGTRPDQIGPFITVTTVTCNVGDSSTCGLGISLSDQRVILQSNPDDTGCRDSVTLTATED